MATTSSCLMKTGGFVDEMVAALCSHANDGAPVVRRQITESLVDIGRKQPNLVLSACLDFLKRNAKCEEKHRIILLQIMERVLSLRRELINDNLAAPMVELCMSDMTREKEVMAEWQGAASAVLVSAGMRWPDLVMDQLLARFAPGTLPHYFVMKTLGDFTASNPIAAVPKLKVVLARVLPVLASIKQDNMKWVFATSMWKFCDAVVTYVADIGQAQDKSITVQGFSGEIFPAYEIIFTNWLPSKESKVRAATIQAVGSMCAILTPQQFETQLPRILTAMLALYKRDANHLPITMGLCQLLDVSIRDDSQVLYPHINNLLTALHALACVPPEAEPTSIKNHNELMRCFDIMGRRFPDDVITFLLGRLDIRISKTVKQRTATLLILKHLVTRLGPQLEDRRGLLVSGIQPIARTETSLEVRKTLAQLIIAMAGHNYLAEEARTLHTNPPPTRALWEDGGHVAIEFIVAQCALTDTETKVDRAQAAKKAKAAPGEEEEDSPEELRNMCDNVLNLLTTTIPCMVDVLWPFLLEMLLPQQNTPAMAILAKCVAHLAALKRSTQAPDYIIDFDRLVNLPKPPEIIARLMVMLSVPLRRGRLGLHILQALLALGPALHPNIAPMWDHAVPKLAQYLQTNSESPDGWNSNSWDELVLRLLAETIKVVDSEEWTLQLGDNYAKHLAVYAADSELKRSCFKQLGLVLQKLTKKDYIHTKLQDMFAICQHGNENERQGCAQAFGYCAASHLDIVLQKVNGFLSGPEKKESSGGFLSGLLGGSKPQESAAKGTVDTCFLAFGYIAAYATPSLITTRIDVHILNNIKLHLPAVKTPERKTVAIKALDLIGKAMHPTHLGAPYVLRQRDELLGILLEYVAPTVESKKSSSPRKDELGVPHAVRIAGLNAITTYTFLEPSIPDKLQSDLATRTCAFLDLSSVPPGSKEEKSKGKEKEAADERAKKRTEEHEKGLQTVLQTLYESLAATLFMDTSIAALTRIFNVLRTYSCKPDGAVRERAVNAVLYLLKKYVEYKTTQTGPKKEKHFEGLGACLAFIIPRCTDPVVAVRQRALEAVGIALYIDNMLRTSQEDEEGYNMVPPSVLRPLNALREQIASTEMNDQYKVMQELAGILAHMVAPEELPLLLKSILAGLTDSQLPSALGTCVVLNGLIKNRGEELKDRVPEVLGLLIEEMKKISVDQTLNATLHAVRNLALHHRLQVMNELLAVAVPHPPQVVKSFQVIAKDSTLVMDLVNHLLQLLNYGLLYDEKGQGKDKKYTARPLVLSATAALGEVMQTDEMAGVVEEHYALIFGSLLLRVGTSQGQPDALKVITEAFKSFLECAKEEALQEAVKAKDAWSRLDGAKYTDVITEIAAVVGREHPEHVAPLYRFLLPFMKGNYPGHRVVAACTLAELVNHTAGNGELLHQLVNALLLSLADANIKIYSLRGLGNIVSAGKHMVDKYATTILDALVSYIDNADEVLAMESMNGLSKVFELVDESRVAPTLINLCHRIKPAFEKSGDEMRAASFTLFGTLARFGQDELAVDPFFEQIHMNLPAVTLHINDTSADVQEACKKALRRFGPLMRAEPLNAFLDEQLAPGAYFTFDDFLTDFAKLLIEYYPERMNYYVMTSIEHFQSNWTPIRGSAASFVGSLLGQLPPHKRTTLNVGLITQALVGLLKQKEADVRRRAASAIGLLYDY